MNFRSISLEVILSRTEPLLLLIFALLFRSYRLSCSLTLDFIPLRQTLAWTQGRQV